MFSECATSDALCLFACGRALHHFLYRTQALLDTGTKVQVANLPLHYAVMNEAPEEVVKALLEAHPEGAKEKGQVRAPLSTISPCVAEQSYPRCICIASTAHTHTYYTHIMCPRQVLVAGQGKVAAHILYELPFDVALERGYPAPLLALLMQGAGSAALSDGTQQLPLVSAAEMRVFESLSHLLDPNPRRLKRIISVYALVTEVAKRRPLSDVGSTARAPVQMWPDPGSPASA